MEILDVRNTIFEIKNPLDKTDWKMKITKKSAKLMIGPKILSSISEMVSLKCWRTLVFKSLPVRECKTGIKINFHNNWNYFFNF